MECLRSPLRHSYGEYDMIKQNTLVVVKWVDIVGDDSWTTLKEARLITTHPFVSIGWVLSHTKTMLVITSCYSPKDDTVGSVTSIPAGAVEQITEMKRAMKPGPPDPTSPSN